MPQSKKVSLEGRFENVFYRKGPAKDIRSAVSFQKSCIMLDSRGP
jgi:hypothetical protein